MQASVLRYNLLQFIAALGAVFCFCAVASAEVLPGPPLHTITSEYFTPGKSWLWKYYQDGVLYSTEKYTVLESAPNRVLIQMSTKLPGQTEFFVHHKLEANPQRCLRAHRNPAEYRPWMINLYYRDDGQWTLVDGLTTTAAFEEKFNCNPHRLRTAQVKTFFQTLTTDLGGQEIFQQRKGFYDESSWYFDLPDYPGVMAYKRMSRPEEKIQYEIRFSLSE
jgi:hypothetical protein